MNVKMCQMGGVFLSINKDKSIVKSLNERNNVENTISIIYTCNKFLTY